MTSKDLIRKQTLAQRRSSLSSSQKEQKSIQTSLLSFFLNSPPSAVLAYYPLTGELSLLELYFSLHERGVNLWFPRILSRKNSSMEFFVSSPAHFPKFPSSSLWEPPRIDEPFSSQDSIPILVPSLALDLQGTRLGFGGGYYDRFLSQFPNLLRIAPQYSQYIQKTPLPRDPWDISMHIAISEEGFLDFRK